MRWQAHFPIADPSHVAQARTALGSLMHDGGFDETRAGRGNLVLTEAATNILKHAGEGTLLIRTLSGEGIKGVEVLALDSGPGIRDWTHSSADGVSSTGTQGTGLGAMRRLSDEFDAYSRDRKGTVVRMAMWSGARKEGSGCTAGAVCVPIKGEEVCGDAWGVASHPDGVTLVVADGLGHGLQAHDASEAAIEVLMKYPADSASRILDSAHAALRSTRGAAMAVARCDFARREITYAGAGNISGSVVGEGPRKQMISHNGIVGHKIHSSRQLTYPWPEGALLIMHSDGLETQWNLDDYPGLVERHPALIAAVLYRDFTRGRDDVTVAVLRATA
jgi:anti-sigma regulatory factor (Ser/Thr protein kinase)